MEQALVTPQRYDRTTVLLHWGIALLVGTQWLGAHTIDWFPKGPYRVDARSMHIVCGVVLTAALLYRIYWRASAGVKFPRERTPTAFLAVVVHYALYALLATVLGLGLFNAWLRGDMLFGLVQIPPFGSYGAQERHALIERVVDLHGTASNLLLILAGGHALAGLFHHFVLKDTVLGRMKP